MIWRCNEQSRSRPVKCALDCYGLLLEQGSASGVAQLQVAIGAGEALPVQDIQRHRGAGATGVLYNEYGPTEASVWCSVYTGARQAAVARSGAHWSSHGQ